MDHDGLEWLDMQASKEEIMLAVENLHPDHVTNKHILCLFNIMKKGVQKPSWNELKLAFDKIFQSNLINVPDQTFRSYFEKLKREKSKIQTVKDSVHRSIQLKAFDCKIWSLPSEKKRKRKVTEFEQAEVEKRLKTNEDLQPDSTSVLVNEMLVKENKDLKSTNENLKKVIAKLVEENRKLKAYKMQNNIKKLNQSIKRKTKANINWRKKFKILSKKSDAKQLVKIKKSLSETKKSVQKLERTNKLLKKRHRERVQNEKANNINKIAEIRTEHMENINELKERYEDLENQLEGLHISTQSESEFSKDGRAYCHKIRLVRFYCLQYTNL